MFDADREEIFLCHVCDLEFVGTHVETETVHEMEYNELILIRLR